MNSSNIFKEIGGESVFEIFYEKSISCAHKLNLPYKSKCNNIHGHNYKIQVFIYSYNVNKNYMVIDFSKLKEIITELDHKDLNVFIEQPTAENLAYYLCHKIKEEIDVKVKYIKVRVWEDDTSYAQYKLGSD